MDERLGAKKQSSITGRKRRKFFGAVSKSLVVQPLAAIALQLKY